MMKGAWYRKNLEMRVFPVRYFTSYMVLSSGPTPPHRVDFFCHNIQSSGQDDPSEDKSNRFYQGSARTYPVQHSCTAATLQT